MTRQTWVGNRDLIRLPSPWLLSLYLCRCFQIDWGCGGGEITWIKWNLAWFALERHCVCMHLSAYEEACLRNGSSVGSPRGSSKACRIHCRPTLGSSQCLIVSGWITLGGTPTPAARRTFPSTCLLCPGCGPVREDYTEECSRAHLLKQERRSKLRPRAESSCSLKLPTKIQMYWAQRGEAMVKLQIH